MHHSSSYLPLGQEPRVDRPAPFVIPTSLLPLTAPAKVVNRPTPPPSRGELDGWLRTTHIFPAAFPRLPTLLQPTDKVLPDELWHRREAHCDGRAKRLTACNDIMWMSAERWVRHNGSTSATGVTFVCAHANGMHKEIWDETLRNILARGSHGEHLVDEVWTLDAVTHGDGGLLNAANMPDIFDWTDSARDVINFLVAYLPLAPAPPSRLPPVLPRVSEAGTAGRRADGFKTRKIIGLGHSMGATSIILACRDAPQLFHSLILCDPIVFSPFALKPVDYHSLTKGALRRRNVWPDRTTMMDMLSKSSFFSRWHPAVLKSYVDYGTHNSTINSPMVHLKCSPYQEASAYTDVRGPNTAWIQLASIPDSVSLLWILSGIDNSAIGGDDEARRTVWRRASNSRNVVLNGVGHLVVHESPTLVAEHISDFLYAQFGSATVRARI